MINTSKKVDVIEGHMHEFLADAKIFKALCEVKRLAILEQLKSGEKCACVLIDRMNMGQSALSYHMKVLCESGLVASRQEGKWTHYRLDVRGRNHALERLADLTKGLVATESERCR